MLLWKSVSTEAAVIKQYFSFFLLLRSSSIPAHSICVYIYLHLSLYYIDV